MLAISVFMALRDAVGSCGAGQVKLRAPATPEAVLQSIAALKNLISALPQTHDS
jgi:xanthine dehydrogenase molybdopterin-binding subunit B